MAGAALLAAGWGELQREGCRLMGWELHHGDCIEVMAGLPAASVGAVVTDPPYELGFMGKAWDGSGIAYSVEMWRGAFRVLKPGGYLLAFGGTRTYHRMAVAIEDAGFTIRDSIHWLYGSGFPKSLNIGKAIDDAAGATREIVGSKIGLPGYSLAPDKGRGIYNPDGRNSEVECAITAPATDLAQQWDGWGTALKPAHEPVIVAQKPLQGTYAANVAKWGVGGLNIAATRIAHGTDVDLNRQQRQNADTAGMNGLGESGFSATHTQATYNDGGRWPTNLLLTHHPDCNGACAPGCPVAILDAQSGERKADGYVSGLQPSATGDSGIYGHFDRIENRPYDDSGGASRFYPTFRFEAEDFAPFLYVAKAARSEREKGLRPLAKATPGERTGRKDGSAGLDSPRAGAGRTNAGANVHPTVKPVQLMRWLVRLVTPAGETVLDPFLGSGTTGIAATMEGRAFVGIEREAQYLEIARHRLQAAQPGLPLGAA